MKSNALDRCVWEMHHSGKISIKEVEPRVYDVNNGFLTVYATEYKILHKNGGVLIGRTSEFTRANWRTKINALLKMQKEEKELDFKEKQIPLL